MESLGEILKRIRTNISREDTVTWSSAEPTEGAAAALEPECPICKGSGFVHPMLPSGHPDFSRVVPCQCNQGESEEERLSRLQRDAGDLGLELLRNMSFENFDRRRANLPKEQQENLERAFRLARDFAESLDGWLVLQGPTGCGKTHLAAAIANYQLQKGKPVFFKVVPDLLDHLRSTFTPESKVTYDELFERVKKAPLLILDDFGKQASTPWAQEKLYQVINYRYNARLSTVITTRLSLEDIELEISSRMIDPKVSTVFGIIAPDFRGDHTATEMGKRHRGSRTG
ncbi:MAG: AAA family ATPase [Dehalococcoidia bacterium]|nr:MAG: AAA family ATPase [Dehalococcoidia bacterium]